MINKNHNLPNTMEKKKPSFAQFQRIMCFVLFCSRYLKSQLLKKNLLVDLPFLYFQIFEQQTGKHQYTHKLMITHDKICFMMHNTICIIFVALI